MATDPRHIHRYAEENRRYAERCMVERLKQTGADLHSAASQQAIQDAGKQHAFDAYKHVKRTERTTSRASGQACALVLLVGGFEGLTALTTIIDFYA